MRMTQRIARSRGKVPYLHEKQIERETDVLLAEFSERFFDIAKPPVPVDEIAELHLALILEFKDMKSHFPFADVHGAIWFEQGKIGIDQTLDPTANPNRRGRYHFTLAHEVGHWQLHRRHFLANPAERRLFDDGSPRPDVVCRSSERKKPVEWQADAFAATLLMPRRMVFAAWQDFRGGDDRAVELRELRAARSGGDILYRGRLAVTSEEIDDGLREEFCRPLAETFQVSPEAMSIRLKELGLIVTQRPPTLFD